MLYSCIHSFKPKRRANQKSDELNSPESLWNSLCDLEWVKGAAPEDSCRVKTQWSEEEGCDNNNRKGLHRGATVTPTGSENKHLVLIVVWEIVFLLHRNIVWRPVYQITSWGMLCYSPVLKYKIEKKQKKGHHNFSNIKSGCGLLHHY